MALTECANGHLYDSDQYVSCPYCGGNMNLGKFRTAPDSDPGNTADVIWEDFHPEPVTGWLVCVEGAEKGRDYRITAKINGIGRSETMDICIKGDPWISRENQARISYDGEHNNFYLIPTESPNPVYINDELLYVPTRLNKGDILKLGRSKFIFSPFCDDVFNWQDGVKQDG